MSRSKRRTQGPSGPVKRARDASGASVAGEPGAMTEDDISRGWYVSKITKDGMSNPRFEAYYRGHVVPESEWAPFMASMRDQLPVCFRLSSINGLHEHILERLRGDCFGLPRTPQPFVIPPSDRELATHAARAAESGNTEAAPEPMTVTLQAPTPMPWYSPRDYAWQIQLGKRTLKKVPALARFRAFLMREDAQGNCTRQEAVSMIPPQLLDVKPHHIVLDMCAAPGSKTAQLLEALHAGGPSVVPSGLVIANDADHKRAYMLVHQLKRLGSPAFLVSTHQGQFFPNLFQRIAGSDGTETVAPLRFDRILCDVPCSGDGTIRKNPGIWRSWTLFGGHGLHPLQLSIAWRAAQMLKTGGRMVYSTCSLNPIENEAVIAELVRRSRGALRVVDVSDKLPGLISEPGMEDWNVFVESNKKMQAADAAAAASETGEPASAAGAAADEEEAKTDASGIVLKDLCSLADVDSLPHNRRRRVRLSYFPPGRIASFRAEAAAAAAAPAEAAAAPVEAVEASDAADKSKGKGKEDAPPRPFARDLSVYAPAMMHGPAAGRVDPTGAEMGLRHCVRVLPHRQDTGGFFIVLLEKVAELPEWEGDSEVQTAGGKPAEERAPKRKDPKLEGTVATAETKAPVHSTKPQEKIWNDFPFAPLPSGLVTQLENDYGLKATATEATMDPARPSAAFPFDPTRLFTRSDATESTGKRVYYVSPAIAALLTTPANFRLKVVHSGLKIFEGTASALAKHVQRTAAAPALAELAAQEAATPAGGVTYRISQGALAFLAPLMRRQVLDITLDDMRGLLANSNGLKVVDLTAPTRTLLETIPATAAGLPLAEADAKASAEAAVAAEVAAGERFITAAAGLTEAAQGVLRASCAVDVAIAASKAAGGIALGSCVVRLPRSALPDGVVANDVLCAAWRTGVSLSVMIDNAERASLSALITPVDENAEVEGLDKDDE